VTLESDIYPSCLSFICPASSGEQTITGVSIDLCCVTSYICTQSRDGLFQNRSWRFHYVTNLYA